jgi:uncharacterized damage-inducible protein DinB
MRPGCIDWRAATRGVYAVVDSAEALSMRSLHSLFLLCVFTVSGMAQTKNPVTSVIKEILPRQSKNIQAAVELMPADKFSYKPTDGQMTFGHLVGHIVEANYLFCQKASDAAPSKAAELKDTDSKEKLEAALKASFDYCSAALEKTDDSKLGDTVQAFGGKEAPRAWAFIALTNNWADHYSAAAQYLRLNGILPPTAQKK